MTDRSVAIRLATDGKEQVKRDLTEIGDTGDAQARRWQKAYDQAGSVIDSAVAKQQQAAQKLAAIVPATSTQQIYQAGASTNYSGQSARDSATALKQLLDEQDRLAASAAALKARIDPLAVAQAKYDAEVANAHQLFAANLIDEKQRDAQLAISEGTLNRARRALGDHSSALGFNRMQFLIAEGAAHRYVDSILAGMSPMRAFMMQAGDVGNILAMDDGGVAGGLAKVTALINPTTIGVAALTAIVAVGVTAWVSYEQALAKLNGLAMGAGRVLGESGQQLEDNAEAAARAGDMTVKAARDIEASYLQIARSGEVLVGLTAITQDFAAATGEDAKTAASQLGAAFADPIQGAQDLADKYGMLTQAQIEHIAKLVEEGEQGRAQVELLGDVSSAVKGASKEVDGLTGSWKGVFVWASNAIDAMGRVAAETPSLFHLMANGGLGWGDFLPDNSKAPDRAAAGNQARQRAQAAADQFTGASQLESIRGTVGTLRAGIAAGGDPSLSPAKRAEQVAAWTTALNANENALHSWIPAQDKANKLSALDAQIAAAKTPAQKQALAAERERVQLAGTVITAQDAENRATDAGNKALAAATHHSGAHAQSLARQAESMEVAAKASLTLADAYLTSSAAGIEADAQRKAATDATRKGIDVSAQAQRQLNLDIAQAVANGAKSVSQLRDETASREKVNAQVSGGTLAASRMNEALSDEAALRPLLTLRTVAHGDALTELNKVIDAYTAALGRAHAAEADSAFLAAMDQSRSNVAELTAGALDLSLSRREQAVNAARRAATKYANDTFTNADGGLNVEHALQYVDQRGLEAAAGYAAAIARSFDQQYRSNQDNLRLDQAELATFGMSADQRQLILSHLQRQLDLQRQGFDLEGDAARALLAEGDAIDAANLKLRAMNDNWQELTQFGDQFLSDALNPQNWSSWGDVGKRILQDLEQEMIKLAALNPLKNMLFGENNPTLGSVGGILGSLFGGGSGSGLGGGDLGGFDVGSIDTGMSFFPHNAAGTARWSGGATWVNENGPEIADLPNGTRIYPASETRRMLAAANDRGSSAPVINQTFNNNFAGGAATMRDVEQMGQIAYQGAINAIRESDRRRG
ncbi:MAG: phage tail length tape measure family protein [Sphingomonas sp.]